MPLDLSPFSTLPLSRLGSSLAYEEFGNNLTNCNLTLAVIMRGFMGKVVPRVCQITVNPADSHKHSSPPRTLAILNQDFGGSRAVLFTDQNVMFLLDNDGYGSSPQLTKIVVASPEAGHSGTRLESQKSTSQVWCYACA